MGFFTFDNFLYVIMSTFANDRIDRQTIRLDRWVFSHIRFYEVSNGRTVSFVYHSHFGKANGIAMGRCFNNYSRFRSTPAALTPPRYGTAKERVIDLNNPSQLIGSITILHRMANLVQHRPCFPIAQTKLLRKGQGRYPSFVSAYQIYCPEPQQKRSPGSMHNSSSCQRCLMSPFLALIQFTLSNTLIFSMSTAGTNKSLRPSKFKEFLFTIFFSLIFFLKFQKTYFLVRPIYNNPLSPIYLRFAFFVTLIETYWVLLREVIMH